MISLEEKMKYCSYEMRPKWIAFSSKTEILVSFKKAISLQNTIYEKLKHQTASKLTKL